LFPINPHHLHVLEVTKDGYVGVTLRVEGGGYLPDVALERKESMGPPVTVDITRAGANGTQAVAALADPRQRHGRGRRGRS
jgi:two-component sensor histidine kinase